MKVYPANLPNLLTFNGQKFFSISAQSLLKNHNLKLYLTVIQTEMLKQKHDTTAKMF
jgi:hypothetical protein